MEKSKILLGAGCFWGVENIFSHLKGVEQALSGYAGGDSSKRTYKEVCSGLTGHAEVVEVIFDRSIITLSSLLDIFFKMHDPTTLNRQGPDVGTQYRSVIFYNDEEQKKEAFAAINRAQSAYKNKIVTEVSAFKNFIAAEDYHQNYLDKNPLGHSCHIFPSEYRNLLK
jgi:peptide-methionine (S)-S-oxide reductase